VFTQDELRRDVMGCPGIEERRGLWAEFVQQIAELLALDTVEQQVSHVDRFPRSWSAESPQAGFSQFGPSPLARSSKHHSWRQVARAPNPSSPNSWTGQRGQLTGAATFRRLLEAEVNLEFFLPVRVFGDDFYAVICPDTVAVALAALGDLVVATLPWREVRHPGSAACEVVQSSMIPCTA
jgi:hypothetical protein